MILLPYAILHCIKEQADCQHCGQDYRAFIVTVQPSAKLQQMMHRNGKKSRFAPHNSEFSQKTAKTPRGIHHG
jgi:hypothetical protein